METPTFAAANQPAAALLAQTIWKCLDSLGIQCKTGFPFGSVDFSSVGVFSMTVNGNGHVTLSFPGQSAGLVITGTLDLTKLEDLLVSAPNFLDVENDGAGGRPGIITGGTVAFGGSYAELTRQKSGAVHVTAELTGTQTLQAIVTVALYRDFGAPGQVQLGSAAVAPGGLGSFNWSASITAIDELPDASPHSYTIVATGSAGSVLTVPASVGGSAPASIQAFEMSGPS